MQFKDYERREKISFTVAAILSIFLIVGIILIPFARIAGTVVGSISGIGFFVFLKLSDFFYRRKFQAKVSNHLNKNEYTEVFLKRRLSRFL